MADNSTNNAPKKTVTVKCEGCGNNYEVPRSTYDQSRRLSRKFLCKDCKKKKHEESMKNLNKPIDLKCEKCGDAFQLKRARFNTIKREGRQFLCPKCIKELQAQRMTERNNSKTPEEKKAFYEFVSECRKDYWKNMDKDTFKERMDALNDGKRNWEENKTPEEIARISQAHTESNIRRWNNKTDEEKELERQLARERWANKTPEEKTAHAQRTVDMWKYMDPIKRSNSIHKRLNATGRNNFHVKFETIFNSMMPDQGFKLIPEYHTNNQGNDHSWDYGISDADGDVTIVIDLDGSFYHADVCDYDGIHSKEEYDERRGLSVPNGMIPLIVNEESFGDTYANLIRNIRSTSSDYAAHLFKLYRSMPFPEPKYSDKELINSYRLLKRVNPNDKYHKSLSLNTRLGDRLIYHFHPSIWQQSLPGHISPYDAWYDDDILKEHVNSHILFHSHLNRNKILQGFAVSPTAPRMRFMSGGKAKMIINRYLKGYNTVFDPNMEYGGRMLGTVSSGKKYVGICSDEMLYRESIDMIQFIRTYFNIDVTINPDGTEYPCMFTEVDNDDQITGCLSAYKCQRYVFITSNTTLYNEYVVDLFPEFSYPENTLKYIIVIDR